jgi:putative glutamine amidotransferase
VSARSELASPAVANKAGTVSLLIGITSYVEQARWGAWDMRAVLVPESYVRLVHEAGARAVVVPPDEVDAPDFVRRLDGLVLAGGADIEPARYGAAPHELTVTRLDRDRGEFAVLNAALDADLPVLGVCRGAELLAVAYSGTLYQHLPDRLGTERHAPEPGVFGAHPARFVPGSRAAAIFGETAEVNSYHHQAIADSGELIVTGWSDDDVIEAVEDPARRFVIGVQWHPEAAGDVRPFAALVRAAAG